MNDECRAGVELANSRVPSNLWNLECSEIDKLIMTSDLVSKIKEKHKPGNGDFDF